MAYTIEETPQEAYDKIRAYFSKPGAVIAADPGGNCFYRVNMMREGPACAVGCLIPDDEYDSILDTQEGVVSALVQAGYLKVSDPKTLDFLIRAQQIHDKNTSDGVAGFLEELRHVALNRGIKA